MHFSELVSEENLNEHLDIAYSDEVGVLAKTLRRMVVSLRGMMAASEAQAEEVRSQTRTPARSPL